MFPWRMYLRVSIAELLHSQSLQSCPTIYNPMDYSPPDSCSELSSQEYLTGLLFLFQIPKPRTEPSSLSISPTLVPPGTPTALLKQTKSGSNSRALNNRINKVWNSHERNMICQVLTYILFSIFLVLWYCQLLPLERVPSRVSQFL